MSTRYVWEKSNVKISISFSALSGNTGDIIVSGINSGAKIIACSSYSTSIDNNGNLKITPSGSTYEFSSNNEYVRTSTYPYIVGKNPSGYDIISRYSSGGTYWIYSINTTNNYIRAGNYSSTNISTNTHVDAQNGNPTISSGTVIERLSSSSSSTYPNDGAIGDYYYDYLGSDNIDPTAVTYSTNNPILEDGVSVRVTERSNIYGGEISYQYQYSEDGGSTWKNGAKTTQTSRKWNFEKTNTPFNFRARVLASDNYGFTSSTYVYGPTVVVTKKLSVSLIVNPEEGGSVNGSGEYVSGDSVTVRAVPKDGWEFVNWTEGTTVVSTNASYTFTITGSRSLTANFKQKLKLWVGVNGKARKGVALYVGVNGKARKAVGAWIGVNGKARKFL